MKKIFLNTLLFVKRISFFYRLIGFVFGWALLAWYVLPDIKYNIAVKNPQKLSIETIAKADKSQLPRYIIVSNARPLQAEVTAENLPDNVDPNMTKLIEAGLSGRGFSYVQEIQEKKGKTKLVAIDYPVYSNQVIQNRSNSAVNDLICQVIVRDSKVTEAQLENDKYFTDSTFSVEGRFGGDFVDKETRSLLESNGYKVSPQAIVLERGATPLSLQAALIWGVVSILVIVLIVGSFVPSKWLEKTLLINEQPVLTR